VALTPVGTDPSPRVDPIPPRILLKQGTTYDYVSGATESSDAFQDAVAEALSQAK